MPHAASMKDFLAFIFFDFRIFLLVFIFCHMCLVVGGAVGVRGRKHFLFLFLQLLIFDILVPLVLFAISSLSLTASHYWLSRFNAFDFLRGLISAFKCVKWLNKVLARGMAGSIKFFGNQKWAGNVRSFASFVATGRSQSTKQSL